MASRSSWTDRWQPLSRSAWPAATFADTVGMRPSAAVRELIDPILRDGGEALGADGFDQAWSEGQGMTLAEAVAGAGLARP